MWRIKAELYIRTITGYWVILVALFLWAWLQDKIINALIILMAYASTRWVFPITYHAKTDSGCLMFTIACFSIAITISLPINLSIIVSVIVGAVISIFLFFLQYFIELLKKPKLTDKEAFIEKCKTHGYNELKTEIAIKFFIDNEKPKSVWEWLCNEKHEYMEWDSVKQMKWRMKKDLFK